MPFAHTIRLVNSQAFHLIVFVGVGVGGVFVTGLYCKHFLAFVSVACYFIFVWLLFYLHREEQEEEKKRERKKCKDTGKVYSLKQNDYVIEKIKHVEKWNEWRQQTKYIFTKIVETNSLQNCFLTFSQIIGQRIFDLYLATISYSHTLNLYTHKHSH